MSWLKVIRHCVTATASKQPPMARKIAESLLQDVPDFSQQLGQWLPLIDRPKDTQPDPRNIYQQPLFISEPNQNVLRGLVWCYSFVPDDALPSVLAAAGWIPTARSLRLANVQRELETRASLRSEVFQIRTVLRSWHF